MSKSNILKVFVFISLCNCHFSLFCQEYLNNDGAKEKHFIYEVKEIDEFFERFNDDPGSFIRGVYRIHHVKFNLDRRRLIKSLFNHEYRSWDTVMINKFISGLQTNKIQFILTFMGGTGMLNWLAGSNTIRLI
jgi:hypothetical protein